MAWLSEYLAQAGVSTFWGKRGLDAGLPASVAQISGVDQHSAVVSVLVLLTHAAAGIAVGLAVLHWQNRRR